MTAVTATRNEARARAMKSFLQIDAATGDNPPYASMERMMAGYGPFTDRVVGDAFAKIDTIVCRLAEGHADGSDIEIDGAVLSCLSSETNKAGETSYSAIVLDADGRNACRLHWSLRSPHGEPDVVVSDVSIREVRAADPGYPYTNILGSATVVRPHGDRGTTGTGMASCADFAKLTAALDVLRPFVAANLDSMDHGRPVKGMDMSFSQITFSDYQPMIDIDGGLPGELALEVSDAMADIGVARCFRYLGARLTPLVEKLEAAGAVFGKGHLCFNDLDYYVTAVPRPGSSEPAVLVTNISLVFDHNTYLAWNDRDEDGNLATTSLVPLLPGRSALALAEAMTEGTAPAAETGVYDHGSRRVSMSRAFMETDIMATAPFSAGYSLEEASRHDPKVYPFSRMLGIHDLDDDDDAAYEARLDL